MAELLPRTLRYREGRETRIVSQDELLDRLGPVVVLGEAGMGKTRLLEWLGAQDGHAFCTARQLVNRHDPRTLLQGARTLVVDALDEVASRKDGDAVDLVVRKLGEAGLPRFVLSCRVAEWQAATSAATIAEQYDEPPMELHIDPFSEDDAAEFLARSVGKARANEVVGHFRQYGLRGFLGNPQTLEMIARVAAGDLPRSSSELFARTIEVVRCEHREERARKELPRDRALAAAGAAFAGLLLTGGEAISRRGAANLEDGELALAEVEAFAGGSVEAVLGTRMFRSRGAERFSYWHRRIGEHLGARWLSAKADTRGKRRRLLAMFHSGALVPASLRGIHAWLALDPELSGAVVSADPMGVIEYGDADVLDVEGARNLLRALDRVAAEDPNFRGFGPYRARALVQPALIEDVRTRLFDRSTSFGLRLLLLEQIEGSAVAADLREELEAVLLDASRGYSERSGAADALLGLADPPDWSSMVETLRRLADDGSTRLAVHVVETAGYGLFDDEAIAGVVMAHVGLTLCAVPVRARERTIGTFMRMKRELPADRAAGVLDILAEHMAALVKPNRYGPDELNDLAIELVARAVSGGGVNAGRLWRWLAAAADEAGYDRAARDRLAAVLRADDRLRHEVQRQVILEASEFANVFQRLHRLGRRSSGLSPDEADLVSLMACLDPADRRDERWRVILRMGPHDADRGSALRDAARPFAAHRPDLLEWLDRLATPRPSRWEVRETRSRLRASARAAVRSAGHRRHFEGHVAAMRAGEFRHLVAPAKAYLKLFHDIGDEAPAHGRVSEWLGPAIAVAAHAGFEAFLTGAERRPTAIEIARSLAGGTSWAAGNIIVAAFAERWRSGIGFADLPTERLAAGWLELRHGIEDHAGFPGLRDALAAELRRRGRWRSVQVLLIEPQLRGRRGQVEGLHELMRGDPDVALSVDLASGWLRRFPDPGAEAEGELLARVMGSSRWPELEPIARGRLAGPVLPTDRRRRWLAVRLIVDFDNAAADVAAGVDPELLWELRHHLGVSRHDGRKPRLDPPSRFLGWLISTFRMPFPATGHPGQSSGRANPWDATDFINWAISRLGERVDEEALDLVEDLLETDDGYRTHLRIVMAEQRRRLAEARHRPPTLRAIAQALEQGAPSDAADLQAVLLEALAVAQARLKGDPRDWYKGFFRDDGLHREEEGCRDELLKLLDGMVPGVDLRPEGHLADDRRVDIECGISGDVMVPIEIKGQWHDAIWTAADAQLDRLYSSDWRADRRGIYVVLWFGAGTRLTAPPVGTPRPETPEQLRAALTAGSAACNSGAVEVVVLDLTRP